MAQSAYMSAEGAIAITAALLAGSVALLGFGLDSVIEALASIIVIWRFTGTRRLSEHAEQRAQRLVAISFFLLAPYIAQDAIRTLTSTATPTTSWLGIALSVSSIITMPLLGTPNSASGSAWVQARPPARARRRRSRLPRYRRAHRPRAQRRVRPVVGRPRRRARGRRARHPRRPANLAGPRLLRRVADSR